MGRGVVVVEGEGVVYSQCDLHFSFSRPVVSFHLPLQ